MTDLPRHTDLMMPTLRHSTFWVVRVRSEIDLAVIEAEAITQDALDAVYDKSGAPVIPDRLSWARSYLKYAGVVENPNRGVWTLTERGREAFGWTEAELQKRVNDGYRETKSAWRHKKPKKATMTRSRETTNRIGPTALKSAPSRRMHSSRLSQRILRASGVTKVEVSGKSGDGGIDGVAELEGKSRFIPRLFPVQTMEDFCWAGGRS